MIEPIDLFAQGDPETVVILPGGTTLVGLHIRGTEHGAIMFGIREDAEGQPVSCAIGVLELEHLPHQSNPRRREEDDGN